MKLNHTYFYHPENIENNAKIIQEFEEQEISMQKIQNALGRENRFIVPESSDETTLSMAIEAAKGVLKESNTPVSDIDIIVFVSTTPEHQIPCDSIKIHYALQAKNNTLCYDINVNCIGALVALDQVSKYLETSNFAKKALIVCAEKLSNILDSKNPVTAFCFSDCSFAFIVEKDNSNSGLIDILYHTDSSFCDTVLFPPTGYSCYDQSDVTMWDTSFDGSGSVNFAVDNMKQFLEKNNLNIEKIDLFLFSQLSIKNIKTIQDHYHIPEEKIPFYSKELGYSGSSSPFLALDQYQKNVRKLKKGENILIWTLGAGYQAGLMLWRY
ncbi:ketoacyl-ACP synthase III [Elizabethkingia meningoseptica]|uniref:3-oxoacyl-ACP synthase III family protein n=1 Tax=Elizabethkingia meningoseptica TaxID=238 RepID=UPI0023B10B9E|nr:3-oxoacyl-[acyl-carrier-protein] synthase III C-terminal domain-containing protein [Elizabethkingia meningoseptica]MDE5436519.1 ketoacyl-ACP synthase III [Elizabethkingia meningoseptica]MDE5508281.1 ketoacyl-ACP synthase III [Elizabethkingia meningoseptica]MDE5514971.1 ketoacyl-ACP synthase III [Elizabethkingia meningoseptica]MDE5525659.1 ketoacyl-ACP synthase III [Elizabethkingia meningoseptica]MDE5529237.1 ketoacyl-ACP synthase III [Elizabethkingia meningoseptica]